MKHVGLGPDSCEMYECIRIRERCRNRPGYGENVGTDTDLVGCRNGYGEDVETDPMQAVGMDPDPCEMYEWIRISVNN